MNIRTVCLCFALLTAISGCGGGGGGGDVATQPSGSSATPTNMTWDTGSWDQVNWN